MIMTVGTNAKDQPVTYLRSFVEFLERRPAPRINHGEANVSQEQQQRLTTRWTAAMAVRCCSTSAPAPRSGSRTPVAAPHQSSTR